MARRSAASDETDRAASRLPSTIEIPASARSDRAAVFDGRRRREHSAS